MKLNKELVKKYNTTKNKCIIVDYDGTLANNDHRQHLLKVHPRKWDEYKPLAYLDTPHLDIIWLVKMLKKSGCSIVIATAREESEREISEAWLKNVAYMHEIYDKMYMRETGDTRDDSVIKLEMLEQIRNDGYDPFMVIDDRNRAVEAWRSAGLRCLQVAPGDF